MVRDLQLPRHLAHPLRNDPVLKIIMSQPCSDAICPCNTASSTLSCLFQQKERDKAEVSTSRGGTGRSFVRTWLTRDTV